MSNRSSKLADLSEIEGLSVEEMMVMSLTDGSCPGICMNGVMLHMIMNLTAQRVGVMYAKPIQLQVLPN